MNQQYKVLQDKVVIDQYQSPGEKLTEYLASNSRPRQIQTKNEKYRFKKRLKIETTSNKKTQPAVSFFCLRLKFKSS